MKRYILRSFKRNMIWSYHHIKDGKLKDDIAAFKKKILATVNAPNPNYIDENNNQEM